MMVVTGDNDGGGFAGEAGDNSQRYFYILLLPLALTCT